MVNGWSNLDAARAALADPATPPGELLAICLAQPRLSAEAAMHPAADGNLLGWLAGQDDPIVAATAQARLTTLPPTVLQPTPPHPAGPSFAPAQAPAPAPQPSGPAPRPRRKNLIVALVGSVVVLALVVTGVTVILPRLTGGLGAYSHAPDFRERPGILAVDAQARLPNGDDQTWNTNFTPVPGTGIALAYNSTSAFSDYRQKLTEYNEAAAAYRQWETDYGLGYADGKRCLTKTDEMGWYSSMESYCSYSLSEYASTTSTAGQAGFHDAIAGLPATPAEPGSGYFEAPQVPDKPDAPTVGDNILGVDLKTGKVAWTLDLGTIWPGVRPTASQSNTDGGRTLLVVGDPTSEEHGDERMLAILDDRTGTVKAGRPMHAADLSWASLYGDVVVVTDEDGNLRGISASDLATEKWTTSAKAIGTSPDSYKYGFSAPPGYLLTADGYLKLTDGSSATFARDAGQDGIQLTVLNGTQGDLIRVEAKEDRYDVSGFDAGTNTETWHLDDVAVMPTKAGGLLLATSDDEVAAYRVNGSDLERKWRYSCSDHCSISFVDDARVFVEDYAEDEFVILKTSDGAEIDRVRDEYGYGPIVGTSVAYLRTEDRLIAIDLNKAGTPTLWRSNNLGGWLTTFDGSLVLADASKGLLGIIGIDADDWDSFKPVEE